MAARLDVEINAKGAVQGSRQTQRALDGVNRSAVQADKSINLFNKSLAITTGVTVFVAGMAAATNASVVFKNSLAEVSTLLGDVPGELEAISEAAKTQAVQFGSLPIEQTKAFYQIISAGASTAAEATETLTAANKLAVGGVTTVAVAADGLTSVLNVYGDQVSGATEITDSLFTAMKAGKTTIGELSANIGKVAPLAEKSGVSFDELTASIAALTKGGISTAESITGVRAILAAIIKPSSEAQKISKQLGIEFNVAGLKAKGFAGFLKELETETNGSTVTLSKLFGGVEALVPLLALSGKGAASFAEILDQMREKAGATEEAFDKMASSPGFQIKRFAAALTVIAIETGDMLSNVLAPALEFVIDNIELIINIAKVAGVALIAAFGPTVATMIGSTLVTAIMSAVAAIRALTVAAAANPLVLLTTAFGLGVIAISNYRDELKELSKDQEKVAESTNDIVGSQLKYNELLEETIQNIQGLRDSTIKRSQTLQDLFKNIERETELLNLKKVADDDEIERFKILQGLKDKNITLGQRELRTLEDLLEARRSARPQEIQRDTTGDFDDIEDFQMTDPALFGTGYEERLAEMVDNTKFAAATMGQAFADVFGPGGTLQQGFANSTARALVFGDNLQDSLVNLGKQITAQLISKFIQAQLTMATTGAAAQSMAATTSGAIIAGNSAATATGMANQQALASSSAASSAQIAAAAAPAAATTSIATAGGSSIAGTVAFTAAMVAMLALVARANGLAKFAKGGAFTNQVVDSPTVFQMGQMGEAGPEAILPLKRNSSGQLGVMAATTGAGKQSVFAPVISVNIERAGENAEEVGQETARQIETQMELSFNKFLIKQMRPGGQLNRQRSF